jgi:hypothetical protein
LLMPLTRKPSSSGATSVAPAVALAVSSADMLAGLWVPL